jgi:hypothetical protein
VKEKQKINVRQGTEHNENKTRIKTIIAQTQNIKHLSDLHV